jgi:hypothetical protein
MIKDEFTQAQIIRIYEFLSNLNDCNIKPNSNCKVSAIEMYKDSRNNFVCAYVFQSFGSGDGLQSEIKYIQITPSGEKNNLLDIYKDESTLINTIATMKNIQL